MGIRLLAATGRTFSAVSVHPAQLDDPSPEFVQEWCKGDAMQLFHWLQDNLPTGTYNELRRLIYEELLQDSE